MKYVKHIHTHCTEGLLHNYKYSSYINLINFPSIAKSFLKQGLLLVLIMKNPVLFLRNVAHDHIYLHSVYIYTYPGSFLIAFTTFLTHGASGSRQIFFPFFAKVALQDQGMKESLSPCELMKSLV